MVHLAVAVALVEHLCQHDTGAEEDGDATVTGRLIAVEGGSIAECTGWEMQQGLTTDGPWTVDRVAAKFQGAAV
jgi:hypothetical protein